jgi:carbon monoxide dehydrogenase subunit G
MATSEERMRILTMIQENKISAQQGMQLLEALRDPKQGGSGEGQTGGPTGRQGARWVRVSVTDTNTGKTRVNIRLPVNVVTAGAKLGARFSPEVQGLDRQTLLDLIHSGEVGKIVDVVDDKDGEHVEVFLE